MKCFDINFFDYITHMLISLFYNLINVTYLLFCQMKILIWYVPFLIVVCKTIVVLFFCIYLLGTDFIQMNSYLSI